MKAQSDEIAVTKILILSANPRGTKKLRLDEEVRAIQEGLRRARKRDCFEIFSEWAVRAQDIRRAIIDFKPHIVHFSGHGVANAGLAFESDDPDKIHLVASDALAELFRLVADHVECVLLNACYSAIQARAIVQYIDFVVGMDAEIGDKAAIEFSVGFYDAIGAGYPIPKAYEFGCNAIQLAGCQQHLKPVLDKKSDVKAIDVDTTPKSLDCEKDPVTRTGASQVSTKIKYEFVLSGSIDELNKQRLEVIVAHIQKLSGDVDLTLLRIEAGSVKLVFEGSPEGFRHLQALFESGQLKEILNLEVQSISSTPLVGTVLAVQANYYQVRLDGGEGSKIGDPGSGADNQFKIQNPKSKMLLCTRRSRLKKLGQRVMVGDRVEIEEPDWQGERGAISAVLPRSSELDRPPVANADQILLVFALEEPTLDPHQLSRFLVKAESTGLQVELCLSKSDLVSATDQDSWHKRLAAWGYDPIFISVHQAIGLTALKAHLNHRTTIVSGPSGVGKSSLINDLIPLANLRVGEVSGKLARGRHTTRHVELFELPDGGLLADTPGFNQPELDCLPEELAHYFPEARQRLANASCQFSDCLHRNEPGCVVRGDWERYEYYLDMLDEAIVRQQVLGRMGDEETNLKLKTRSRGQQTYEPKLETKKYRRPSRRTQQQELQALQHEEELSLDGE